MESVVSIPLLQYLAGDVCQVEAFVLVKLHSTIVFFLVFLVKIGAKNTENGCVS
jgi:hypothetical protein